MLSKVASRSSFAVARQPLLAARTGTRDFWNVSLPVLSGPGGAYVTKYRITKPGKDGVHYDDFLITLPERDQLATFSKEAPLFIRYLKAVTEKEGRNEDFTAFFNKAKNGLAVESDVYITTEELLALMWKNGYSEQEKNAIQFTFPSDYKFHYPELSALFDIAEEDTYKFCMRTRMDSSHIGELDWEKVKRKGFIRDHWLVFGTGLLIFKYFPFFNYYFGMKVFGTGLWCTTVWMLVNRGVAKTVRRNEYMAAQKTAADVMDGQDSIVTAMQRFANDAKCVEYLGEFKTETESKIGAYKKAMVLQMKNDLSDRAIKQLQAVAGFEASMGSALQELVVREAASSFREQFPNDAGMQSAAFSSAVQSLAGDAAGASDPVAVHFESAFASLRDAGGSASGDPAGTLAERVAYAQQMKETEFKQTFMVTPEEAAEVKSLVGEAKDLDFSSLSSASAERLDALYTSINAKVGYSLPESLGCKTIPTGPDSGANAYVDAVNSQLSSMEASVKAARLRAFAQAF
jgi:hypothetical protein